MGYYRDGYVEVSYYVSESNPECLPYVDSGYIAEGYYTNNNLQQSYFELGYIDDTYVTSSNGYIEPGYTSLGYFDEGSSCGISFSAYAKSEFFAKILDYRRQVYWAAGSRLNVDRNITVGKFNTLATSALNVRVTLPAKSAHFARASWYAKATKMKDDSLLDWMNSISECCYRQEQRLLAIEAAAKDYLTAKDIEPLFSGREVHFDVQWPGNS